MSWRLMDLAVEHLDIDGLRGWKSIVLGMSTWMQAVVVGVLVLLIGVSFLSLFWGLKMTRSARFAMGSTSTFMITLILLVTEYSVEEQKAFMIAAAAGVAAGFLCTFLERGLIFVAGFLLGDILGTWLLPACFHMKLDAQPGRIWRLVIAIAAGVLFAFAAKKLRFVLTAVEGGAVLGILADAFLGVTEIPWVTEKLTDDQILNLFPIVLIGVGILVQLFQRIAQIREQKALQIPTGEERDFASARSEDSASEKKDSEGADKNQPAQEEVISMAAAEEVLVEKAKELAIAASKSVQNARLKERYEDVAEGLYSSEVAAKRLGITEEEFLEGMKKSGYSTASEEGQAEESKPDGGQAEAGKTDENQTEESKQSEGPAEESKSDDEAIKADKAVENQAEEGKSDKDPAEENKAEEGQTKKAKRAKRKK